MHSHSTTNGFPSDAGSGRWRHIPPKFERFEIQAELGRGGFAVVYKALDTRLNRLVALKVPYAPLAHNPRHFRGLTREAESMAQLQHANIVKLYEFQLDSQDAYLVTELVDGPTLRQWLKAHPQGCPPNVAAKIVMQIADALAHSHSRNILHRDVKPSNILLDPSPSDDKHSLPFVPRLADFGLARVTDDPSIAQTTESVIGTVRYIPPEIISPQPQPHSVASDVYSLGAVLYELLVGAPAFPANSIAEIYKQILDNSSPSPQRVNPAVPKDLAAICVQAMASAPDKRYVSASEFATDLRRFIEGRVVLARRPSFFDHLKSLLKRHPGYSLALTLLILMTTLFIGNQIITNRQLNSLNEQVSDRNEALESALQTATAQQFNSEQLIYSLDMAAADQDYKTGDYRRVRTLLDRYAPDGRLSQHRDHDWYQLRADVRRQSQALWKAPDALYCQAFTSDGQILAVAGADSHITLLNPNTGRVLHRWNTSQIEINDLVITSGNDQVISSGDDGSIHGYSFESPIPLWKVQLFESEKAFNLAYFSEHNRLLCSGHDGTVGAIDLKTRQAIPDWPQPLTSAYHIAAINSRGQYLLGCEQGRLELWDLQTRRRSAESVLSFVKPGPVAGFTVDPTGSIAACFSATPNVIVVDLNTLEPIHTVQTKDTPSSVLFDSVSGNMLVAENFGVFHLVAIDENRKFKPITSWVDSRERVFSVVAQPGHSSAVELNGSGQILKWNLTGVKADTPTLILDVGSKQLSVDAERLLIYDAGGVEQLDLKSKKRESLVQNLAPGDKPIHRADDRLIVQDKDQRLFTRPLDAARRSAPSNSSHAEPLIYRTQLASSLTGKWLAGLDDRTSQVWFARADRSQPLTKFPAKNFRQFAFIESRDLCFIGDGTQLLVWDGRPEGKARRIASFDLSVVSIVVSPDETKLGIVTYDRKFYVVDISGTLSQPTMVTYSQPLQVFSIAFSPTGRSLLSLDNSGTLRVWNLASGQQTIERQYAEKDANGFAWLAPDGSELVVFQNGQLIFHDIKQFPEN